MSYRNAIVLTVAATVLVVGLSAAVSASSHGGAEAGAESSAYAGTHVSFDTSNNAVVNYTVDGATVFSSAQVESRSSAESRGGAGIGVGAGGSLDLSALSVRGAAVANVNAEARASANVGFEGSASFEAHDNGNGVAVLKSGGEEQVVEVEVAADTEAEVSDESVVSFTSNGTESSFIVAGDGEAQYGEGNITARLGANTNAVLRSYGDEKTEDDERQEGLIADGDVAAEVQFTDDGSGEPAEFLSNTSVETDVNAGESVSLVVNRTESEGKVVMTTVTDGAIGTTEEVSVTVDGEAAAEAGSYSELEGAFGNEPRYLVVDGEAEAEAQVLVALDSFSEHGVTIEGEESEDDGGTEQESEDDGDGGTDEGGTEDGGDEGMGNETSEGGGTDDGSDGSGEDGGTDNETGGDGSAEDGDGQGMPGFTVVAALVAALTAVALRGNE
jgi:PGF-CTERM protein